MGEALVLVLMFLVLIVLQFSMQTVNVRHQKHSCKAFSFLEALCVPRHSAGTVPTILTFPVLPFLWICGKLTYSPSVFSWFQATLLVIVSNHNILICEWFWKYYSILQILPHSNCLVTGQFGALRKDTLSVTIMREDPPDHGHLACPLNLHCDKLGFTSFVLILHNRIMEMNTSEQRQ
jgi:hypothetical protein